LEEGIKASDPIEAIKNSINVYDGKIVVKGVEEFDLKNFHRIMVIGAGKATARMALGLEYILGDVISDGIVIAPRGVKSNPKKIKVLEGDHPIPSNRNVENTEKIIELLKDRDEMDLIIVLISGGGSALLTIPENGVEIEDIIETNKLLLKCGADIKEINTVRKQICRVKGGKLFARYIYPSRALTLIISDVVGDDVEVIASGPTAPSKSTAKQAKEILERYGIWSEIPIRVRKRIEKAIIEGGNAFSMEVFNKVRNVVISSNIQTLKAIYGKAVMMGYNSMIISSRVQGEAREVGKVIGGILVEAHENGIPVKPPATLIAGGETTVTVRGEGSGGRNQELALSVAKIINGYKGVTFASMGSDGIDGNTDAAGAIVDWETISKARGMGLNEDEYLRRNDTYNYFKKLGRSLIITGITETNVNDLMIGLVSKGY
jgi:glycerate-2-kinase